VPEARRGGVARALMIALAQECRGRGYKRIDLNVLDWNPARGFYEKLGFKWIRNWLPYRLSGEALEELARVDERRARVVEIKRPDIQRPSGQIHPAGRFADAVGGLCGPCLKFSRQQRRPCRGRRKTKPPALSVSGCRRLSYFYLVLCLNDARRDEENQLLVGGADRGVFEQVAQVRDVAQQRHLRDVD